VGRVGRRAHPVVLSESGWKVINWLVELMSRGKVGESGWWLVVYWLVAMKSCGKLGKSGRKVINCWLK
jgi:hypothetical protein